MHFLRVNATFYDVVNVIHDFITTAFLLPYTAKFIFVGVRNKKNSTNKTLTNKQNSHIVLPYIKYIQKG